MAPIVAVAVEVESDHNIPHLSVFLHTCVVKTTKR